MKLTPKSWEKFQQYKDRKPQWIKLQRDLLNNFSYSSVQIGTKATLPLLWLLSSEYEDGIINASLEEISFRIHIDAKIVNIAIKELVERGFYTLEEDKKSISVQNCTESYEMVPREEKRREEKRREEKEKREKEKREMLENEFQECWKYYTLDFLKKQGRGGGSKKKALTKYLSLRTKYSLEQFNLLINSELNKNVGHRDLERVLTEDNMKQILEDGVVEKSMQQNKMSFKQQDKEISKNKIDSYLDSGYSLRDIDIQDVEVIGHDN